MNLASVVITITRLELAERKRRELCLLLYNNQMGSCQNTLLKTSTICSIEIYTYSSLKMDQYLYGYRPVYMCIFDKLFKSIPGEVITYSSIDYTITQTVHHI